MDFQHRAGGKTGSGGVASLSEANRDRRERLRQLALETIDLNKDPYFMKNHLGSYECKLCLTLHNNEGSYLAHTQGKKHQSNLAKRAARDAKETPIQPAPAKAVVAVKKFVKIGRPGYKVTKQRVPETGQQSLLFQVDYPEIVDSIQPRHRFMSAYEQHIEPPDRKWQYLLFAAEPYETISFKVPSREIDKQEGKFWAHWNKDTKQFFLQFHYKMEMRPPPMMNDRGDFHKMQEAEDEAFPPGTNPNEDHFEPAPPGMFDNNRMPFPSMGGPPPPPPPNFNNNFNPPPMGAPPMGPPPHMGGGPMPPMGAPPVPMQSGHMDGGFMDRVRPAPPPPPMAPPPDSDEPEN